MKKTFGLLAMAFALTVSSCGGDEEGGEALNEEGLYGEWQIVSVEDKDGRAEFKDCEKEAIWVFKKDSGETLSDGTKTKVITREGGDSECDMSFGFDYSEQWAVVNDNTLFISSLRIAGTSFAGRFDVKEFNDESLVLSIFEATITFKKR